MSTIMPVVVAVETNSNDAQETKSSVPLVAKDTNNKKNIHWTDRKEFLGLAFASSVIGLINIVIMFCLYSFTLIQLIAWRKSFDDKWNSDAKKQFNHMTSSLHRYVSVSQLTSIFVIISIIGYRGLIEIWQSISWIRILVLVGSSACLSILLVGFVFPSKTAEIFVENIIKDDYTLSTIPTSLFCFKFLSVFCSIQHIVLLFTILWMKFKYVSFISNDNQYSPSKVVIKEEQMIREDKQEKGEEDRDTIGKDYVIC